jgi:uncharacterized protein YecE (DUF72 family)
VLYVRLSGRTRWYRHDYTAEELTTWAKRIQASGAKEAWIYFNNDREGHAVKNALQLRRILRGMTGERADSSALPAAKVVGQRPRSRGLRTERGQAR